MQIDIADHPLLRVAVFTTRFPARLSDGLPMFADGRRATC
jgi:hypothetical protein